MILLTAEQSRALDRHAQAAGISGLALMEAAAAKASLVAAEMLANAGIPLAGAPVLVLAGRGNNGGDGLALARHLRALGAGVSVFFCGDDSALTAETAANLAAWRVAGGELRVAAEGESFWSELSTRIAAPPALVIDALLGTGQAGPPRGQVGRAAALLARDLAPATLSLDVPTGLSADSGVAFSPHVRADVTVTFGLPKVGLFTGQGRELAGQVVLASIGLPAMEGPSFVKAAALEGQPPARLFTLADAGGMLQPRPAAMHKGDAGLVLVVAGSPGMSGAAALAGLGAIRGGAGLVTVATPATAQPAVAAALREAITHPLADDGAGGLGAGASGQVQGLAGRAGAMVVGPGLGMAGGTPAVVREIVNASRLALVVDADGLNAFAGEVSAIGARCRGTEPLVITPHPGEAGRLLGCGTVDVQADRLGAARQLAAATGGICLLKGNGTVVADPEGLAYVIPCGNPGMATGGAGDVLAGLIGALLARYASGLRAPGEGEGTPSALRLVALAAFLHGLAGDLAVGELGPYGLRAGDIAEHIPAAVALVLKAQSGKGTPTDGRRLPPTGSRPGSSHLTASLWGVTSVL